MGFVVDLLRGQQLVPDVVPDVTSFAVDSDSIDPAVFGISSYASPTAVAPRIDRKSAIQVPAVKRSRDLIAGTLGTLPLALIGPKQIDVPWQLFQQPEQNVPRSVTMTRLYEDLFFEGIAWWRIVGSGWGDYPTKVKRVAPRDVTVNEAQGKVYINGEHVPDDELIRFDSPNDGLLLAGARAIRTCLQLDAAAANMSDGVPAVEYFTPTDGVDPGDDEQIVALLNAYQEARRNGARAYVPAALKLNTSGWNPKDLQLAEARQHAVLEIARVAGIDPEELGVSTTSRTYANQQDRRKAFLDFTLGGYRQGVEDRLSMGDVSPRGAVAKHQLSAFLRSDDKTRMETYKIGLEVGAYGLDEIRSLEDKPALEPDQRYTPAPQAPAELPAPAPEIEGSPA